MKVNLYCRIIFIGIIFFDTCFSQTLPTPNVGSLFKINSTDVNESSGAANISLSLHSIAFDDFVWPISLQYYSRGVKVEEEASNVGTSWALEMSGVINREQYGLPDEFTKMISYTSGYVPPNEYGGGYGCTNMEIKNDVSWYGKYLLSNTPATYLDQHINMDGYNGQSYRSDPVKDVGSILEPDIFRYTLPNGKKGSFLINDAADIVSGTNDKIQVFFEFVTENGLSVVDAISSFIITDDKGTKYYFDIVEKITKQGYFEKQWYGVLQSSIPTSPSPTKIILDTSGPLIGDCPGTPYVSELYNKPTNMSWFLSKIVTAQNKEIIFTYEDERHTRLSPTKTTLKAYNVFSDIQSHFVMENKEETFTSKRLIKIQEPSGYVNILYNTAVRLDVMGVPTSNLSPFPSDLRAVRAIEVYDRHNKWWRNFNTNFFN